MTDDLHGGSPPGSGEGGPPTPRPALLAETPSPSTAPALSSMVPHDGENTQNGLSDGQVAALDGLEAWWHQRRAQQQVFRLFGYAGTGKTTLAKHVPDLLGAEAMYLSFTGKAASVLRAKGCDGARTIHSLLYAPDREPVLDQHGRQVLDGDGNPVTRLLFGRRKPERIAEELCGVGLLIVDEVSMVTDAMVGDLRALGLPILVLGDPEQLPPINGRDNVLMAGDPDVLLTEIHRAALESEVTRLATRVRLAHPLRDGSLGLGTALLDRVGLNTLLAADVVLTWRNATRWEVIRAIRASHDWPVSVPVPGDVVVFLTNRPELGLFNGTQATVMDVLRRRADVIDLLTDLGPVAVDAAGFAGQRGQDAALLRSRGAHGPVPATFGQAMTVHKSQGSEWNRVLLVDETRGMRGMEIAGRDRTPYEAGIIARRWLYTGITRASQQVRVTRAVST